MEPVWFRSGRHRYGLTGKLPVVVWLSLCFGHMAYGFEQTMVVEPGYPFQAGELHCFLALPWSATVNELAPGQLVDGLGQGVVVAVALAAYGSPMPASASRSLWRMLTY